MAKIALITDLHIGARNDNSFIYNNMKKFYRDIFFPELEKRDIKSIINLGDTFDKRKSLNVQTLQNSKRDILDKMSEYQCYFITGNHDVFFNSTLEINSTHAVLREYKNIRILDKPQTINVEGLNICIIPWIVKDNEDETFRELENTQAVICMGHLEIEGFEYYKNSVCKHGYSPKIFSEKFIRTFSGHFHKKSISSKISYLGSPYQTTWQEYEEVKGFHIFDTITFELEFVENPYRLFKEFIYPEPISDVEGNFIRVVVKDIDSRTSDYDLYRESIYEAKPANLVTKIIDRVAAEHTDPVTGEVVLSDVNIEDLNIDNLTISKKYIDSLENFDRKEDMKVLIEKLYMESISVTD